MKKIKLYIATSLDGYIATSDGQVKWLDQFNSTGEDYGYQALIDSVDTILMGGKTFRDIMGFNVGWPYSGKRTLVFTRRSESEHDFLGEDIEFVSNDILPTLEELKQEVGKDIWLVGGGEIISMLLEYNLVDEMEICTMPILLGNGISLFPPNSAQSNWELKQLKQFKSGIIITTYTKK